jgi:DNA-directed RNA polymerase subunit RPC12/RpoP
MEINCLGCGFKVDLAGAYDDYVGQIKCFACGATMEIATQGGEVRAVNAVTEEQIPLVEEFVVRSVG